MRFPTLVAIQYAATVDHVQKLWWGHRACLAPRVFIAAILAAQASPLKTLAVVYSIPLPGRRTWLPQARCYRSGGAGVGY